MPGPGSCPDGRPACCDVAAVGSFAKHLHPVRKPNQKKIISSSYNKTTLMVKPSPGSFPIIFQGRLALPDARGWDARTFPSRHSGFDLGRKVTFCPLGADSGAVARAANCPAVSRLRSVITAKMASQGVRAGKREKGPALQPPAGCLRHPSLGNRLPPELEGRVGPMPAISGMERRVTGKKQTPPSLPMQRETRGVEGPAAAIRADSTPLVPGPRAGGDAPSGNAIESSAGRGS